MKIGIVGLGYVGLPLAVAFAEAGCDVVGFDADHTRVEGLRRSESDYERVVRDAELVLDLRGVTRGIEAPNLVRM